MAQRRDKKKVIYDILNIISNNRNSIKPTPLLRYSNLSFNLFNTYIEELINKKLIIEQLDKKENKSYSLTEKGQKYLEKYKAIEEFIQEFLL